MNGLPVVLFIAHSAQLSALREIGLERPILLYIAYLLIFFILLVAISLPKLKKIKSNKNNFDDRVALLDNLKGGSQLTAEEKRKIRDAMVRDALEKQKKMTEPALSVNQLALLASQGKDAMTETLGVERKPRPTKPDTSATSDFAPAPELKPIAPPPPKTTSKKPEEIEDELLRQVHPPEAPPWESEEGVGLEDLSALDIDSFRTDPAPKAETAPKSASSVSSTTPPEADRSTGADHTSVDLDLLLERGLLSRKDYDRIRRLANQAEKKKSHE